MSPAEIADNLGKIRERIARACERAGRDPAEVTLLCVTKSFPAEAVQAAASAGAWIFGENRVQEGAAKIEALREKLPHISWHLIGHLQRNKAKKAVECFDVIESVDRMEIAEKLNDVATSRVPILLEVNLGSEAAKSGVEPEAAGRLARGACGLAHLDLQGLMVIPPFSEDPEPARLYFRRLRQLRARLRDEVALPLPHLSMGMSGDFEVAIEEGSTIVRLGTAIFGSRGVA